MYLARAIQLSKETVNDLTERHELVEEPTSDIVDLEVLLVGLYQFCLMYLDDNSQSLMNRLADRARTERIRLEEELQQAIRRKVRGNRYAFKEKE